MLVLGLVEVWKVSASTFLARNAVKDKRLTPLLLVGKPLSQDQAKFDYHIDEIGGRHIRLKLGGEQNGVDGGGNHEQQDALDEADESPVEDVEHSFGHMLPDDGPVRG